MSKINILSAFADGFATFGCHSAIILVIRRQWDLPNETGDPKMPIDMCCLIDAEPQTNLCQASHTTG
jgi:hypothetical protein